MIISVNWLKKFTNVDLDIDELSTLIGSRLVEIESVTDLGAKYKNVLVVKVVEAAPLEGTDHLNLTKIDDGGVSKNVERDSNGLVQVVCGAPNVRSGMLAVWLPPTCIVPSTYNDDEPFVLSAKNLRGTISNGMLASPKELDLFDEHDGILEVDKVVKPGTDFASVYELDDFLLDIENKSLTHRPDSFGIIGFAREVAAIQGKQFVTPDWLVDSELEFDSTDAIEAPKVSIDDSTLSERYQAVVLTGADGSAKSPVQIQTYLSRVGVRPINAVVDATNYLMMLTGQPLHAFDYDKLIALSGGKSDIHVRRAKDDEELELLDGRKIKMSIGDIVIASGDTPVGLAGAMGGASTIIDKNTKNIILESATFNLYNLRSTQMRHGIFSEAITRFTKGQPAELTSPVISDAIRLISEWSGAKQASKVSVVDGDITETGPITFNAGRVNSLLGTDFSIDEIDSTLKLVEFATAKTDSMTLIVSAPYWRADIHSEEDVIEEVGRLNGFDSIIPTLPERDFTAVSPSAFDDMRTRIRKSFVRAGANEVLTYSFIHGDTLTKSGLDTENSYRITNSLSPDLQYYRQSLTPSLLGAVYPNIKARYDDFALFELNKTHPKHTGVDDENVPEEIQSLAFVIASKNKGVGAPYYRAKKFLEYIATSIGLSLSYSNVGSEDSDSPEVSIFETLRSAIVTDINSGEKLGVIGEYKKSVIKGFKLPDNVAGFELDQDSIYRAMQESRGDYSPLSRYPSTDRDLCFRVDSSVAYEKLISAVSDSLKQFDLNTTISPIDIYKSNESQSKNITIRITLNDSNRTMTGEEVGKVIDSVVSYVSKQIDAKII
jgi:phenylalanyl-tRNA synthetase beta chain